MVAVKKKVEYVEIKEEVVVEEKELLMKPENIMSSHDYVIDRLRQLPRKMLLLHGLGNVNEFVLHELAKNCFNLKKAAYFIDNPDFNCVKGVAGVSHAELNDVDDIWAQPEMFTQQMMQSPFNQHVRSFSCKSSKKHSEPYEKIAETIAQELGLNAYNFYCWNMKHDNHGFLVCEKNDDTQEKLNDDVVIDGLCLLGFCPIH